MADLSLAIREFTIDIAAGATESRGIVGSRVKVTALTAGATVHLSVDDAAEFPIRKAGVKLGLPRHPDRQREQFKRLSFRNPGGSSASITIVVSSNEIDYDDANTVEVAGTVAVAPVRPGNVSHGTNAAIGSGGTTLLLASDPTRHSALITADPANNDFITIGGNGHSSSSATPVYPGDRIEVRGTGAIYGRSNSGIQKARWTTEID